MAVTPKPIRKEMKKFTSEVRKEATKKLPNKSVRKESAIEKHKMHSKNPKMKMNKYEKSEY